MLKLNSKKSVNLPEKRFKTGRTSIVEASCDSLRRSWRYHNFRSLTKGIPFIYWWHCFGLQKSLNLRTSTTCHSPSKRLTCFIGISILYLRGCLKYAHLHSSENAELLLSVSIRKQRPSEQVSYRHVQRHFRFEQGRSLGVLRCFGVIGSACYRNTVTREKSQLIMSFVPRPSLLSVYLYLRATRCPLWLWL